MHCAVEQAELPGLLKVVRKKSEKVSSSRRAKGPKSVKEDLWWACGRCFFERRKKSTLKDHVIRGVCQKSIKDKNSKLKFERRRLQRHFEDFEEEKFEKYSWKDSHTL